MPNETIVPPKFPWDDEKVVKTITRRVELSMDDEILLIPITKEICDHIHNIATENGIKMDIFLDNDRIMIAMYGEEK